MINMQNFWHSEAWFSCCVNFLQEFVSLNPPILVSLMNHCDTEPKLNNMEKKYLGIFHNAVEGIFLTTPHGRYLDVNPALADINGFTSPEETGLIIDLGK